MRWHGNVAEASLLALVMLSNGSKEGDDASSVAVKLNHRHHVKNGQAMSGRRRPRRVPSKRPASMSSLPRGAKWCHGICRGGVDGGGR